MKTHIKFKKHWGHINMVNEQVIREIMSNWIRRRLRVIRVQILFISTVQLVLFGSSRWSSLAYKCPGGVAHSSIYSHPSKHETLSQYWVNDGPSSKKLAQQPFNCQISQLEFSLTWSCVSLTRSTTSNEWKLFRFDKSNIGSKYRVCWVLPLQDVKGDSNTV